MVAQTRHGQSSPHKKLAFHEKLVGKGLSTDVLLKKLRTLHTQLAELGQDHVDLTSLNTARKELISTSILLHKDRGVKAYAACCIADILRLYAPDAPYTQSELRDIFQFFFRQLTNGLKGTDASYYNEYFNLLESLSTVKSVVLVCDLPTADELLVEIFRDFFALVRRDLAKKIEIFMADILVALVDECQTLPSEVLEIIMAQFMDKQARMEQPAYRLAVQVCNSTADKLQRHVCQYFTDIIVAHSTEEEFDEIRVAHDLIKRLHHSCPDLLHSVIPQIEEELRVEDVTLRSIATQVLGEMYADKGGPELVKKYPATWNVWLARKNDKSVTIRLKFVEATRALLTGLGEMRNELEESLRLKIMDPDEKVRAAACKVYAQLDYEAALHHVTESQLRAVAGRGLDKKHGVRFEALNAVGKLYGLAYPEIENNDSAAIKQFAWIPEEILQIAGTNVEIRSVVEQVISDHIIPLPLVPSTSTTKGAEVDEVTWTDRLLNTMKYLSVKSTNAFLGLTGLKSIRPNIYDHFVETCVKNNGGIIDEGEELIIRKLAALTNHIAGTFPDPHKTTEDLQAFAKLNEPRLYKLLKTCMDPQTDLKGLVKATNEFIKRLEQSSASLVPTMSIFLRRASYRLVNQSCIPTLLKRVQKADGSSSGRVRRAADNACILLTFISKHSPALYKSHIGELTKAIADEKHPKLVEIGLQALAGVVRWDNSLAPADKRTNDRIVRLVLQTQSRHAKFAARLIAFSKAHEEACSKIIENIVDELEDSTEETQVARLAALAQFAKFAPEEFEHKSEVIMTFLLNHVLMTPIPPDPDETDENEEWMEDDNVPDTLKSKILALKVCRNRSLAHSKSEKAIEIATPVLRMYMTLLEQNGTLTPDVTENPKAMSRMRLQAAISLLHLSTVDSFAIAIAPKFLRMAVVIQDSCFNVRISFLTKLVSLLQPRLIPPRYNTIPFLAVHDPEADVKNMASSYVQGAMRKMTPALRVEHFELIFIRLLHLLAHHPDFNIDHDDLIDIAKYVQFYLDLVVTQDNVSLLYHLTSKGKTVRDADNQRSSENFYIMCELAQDLIKSRATAHSWTIQSYPGKVRLPSDILRPLPSAEAASQNLKTVYLTEPTRTWLAELSKPANTKEKKERKPAVKRKAPAKSSGHAKRARSSKKWRSDEESEEESAGDDGSSDVEMAPDKQKSEPEPDGGQGESGEDVPSRGTRRSARTRAKKLSTSAKKVETPSSDE